MTTTADLTAGTVMDAAAALMNDAAKSIYPYATQVPYINIALRELQEFFELNNVPVTDQTSAVMEVDAGVTEVTFSPTPPIANTPYLPDDLIEPKILWQRARGIDPWVPTTRLDVLPLNMAGTETNEILNWVWASQRIKFLASNADLDLKLDYVRNLFAVVTGSGSVINVINAQSFLQYRTAGLLAEFCAENPTRANALNSDATLSLDRVVGIGTKGRQVIMTRHRPFRNGYKRRTFQ
jgi:hypothetical protein